MRWLALALVAALAVPAFAQDAGGDTVTFDALVVDYSAMLASGAASGGAGAEVPLRDAHVRFIVRGTGSSTRTIESSTDGDGRVREELRIPDAKTVVEVLVGPGDDGSGQPAYYAEPWEVARGPAPTVVRCYGVTTDPSVLWIGMLQQSVTRLDDAGTVQLVTSASVVNFDSEFRMFLSFDQPESGGGSVQIPLPAGFELKMASVDNAPAKPTVVQAPHGGSVFALRGTLFPSTRGDMSGTRIQLVCTAPFESGRRYDFSFHPDLPISRYLLTVQEAAFHVTQPDGTAVQIYDGGLEDAGGGAEKMTRVFVIDDIPEHSNVAITVTGGSAFPRRAVLTSAVMALIVLAAALLGIAMRRTGVAKPVERPAKDIAPSPGAQPGQLERLDQRLRRGEITSVEYEIRKRALAGSPPPQRPDAPTGVEIVHHTAESTPREIVGIIEGRVGVASKEQLREDVHSLARLVRELLDRG